MRLRILIGGIGIILTTLAYSQLQPSNASGFTNDYETTVGSAQGAPQPNASVTLTSATVHNQRLRGFEVWTTVRFKALVYTITNGAQAASPSVVGGAPAAQTFQWTTPYPDFVTTGNTAGQDAFAVVVTNLDSTSAADVSVTFHYSN